MITAIVKNTTNFFKRMNHDNLDYKKLGFKSGLEIHQQLDTDKLFCSCPSTLREDYPHFKVKRKLRAVAGETGEIDIAAKKETEKEKTYIYEAYNDTTCLVELDEDPPHKMNSEALNIALQISLILKADIVDAIQVMRKTVVDGSNTSGFQRTALIARNGFIETSKGKVQISTICLEEESARIMRSTGNETIYRLDRLGIPLIEIATDSSIKDPNHCREVAEKLGLLLRSCKVKRGLGTIRQDVNVSIKEGTRIEIKGCQNLKLLSKIVQNEVIRQKKLADLAKTIDKVTASKPRDISEIFSKSKLGSIKKILQKNHVVLGMKIYDFKGKLGKELNKGNSLGKEIAQRLSVLAGIRGILHSDELPDYGITEKEVKEINKSLKCEENDAFILIAEEKEKAEAGMKIVLERLKEAAIGVPKEVRKAVQESTAYLRPMPGSARMYPETDVPIVIPNKKVELPELITDVHKKYVKLGLSEDLARIMSRSKEKDYFESLIEKFPKVEPAFIAELIVNKKKELKTRFGLDPNIITDDKLESIIGNLNEDLISKEAAFEIMIEFAKGKDTGVIDVYRKLSDAEIESIVKEIIEANKDAPVNAVMGQVMAKLRGKAEGKKIADLVKKMIKTE